MSIKTLYTELRTQLETIPELKWVRLWNNQFEREETENPFLFPCCFIEFKPSTYSDLTNGVQQYDMIVTLHLGFESYKDEDIDVLDLKQKIYKKVQRFQSSYFAMLSRVEERQNFDHDNIQDYEIDFRTSGKDFEADTRAITPATITTLTLPKDLKIDNNIVRTGVIT